MKPPFTGVTLRQAILSEHPNPPGLEDQLLDKQHLMQLFLVSERTLYNWRRRGILLFVKVGGCIYYKLSDVRKLAQTHKWDNKPM